MAVAFFSSSKKKLLNVCLCKGVQGENVELRQGRKGAVFACYVRQSVISLHPLTRDHFNLSDFWYCCSILSAVASFFHLVLLCYWGNYNFNYTYNIFVICTLVFLLCNLKQIALGTRRVWMRKCVFRSWYSCQNVKTNSNKRFF